MHPRIVLALLVSLVIATAAWAKPPTKSAADLSGAQQNPEVLTNASGSCSVKFDKELSQADVTVSVKDILDNLITGAHFHCGLPGENGPVAFGMFSPGPGIAFENGKLKVTLTNADLTDVGENCSGVVGRPVSNIAALAFAMREGLIYCNVHSVANAPGAVRGQMAE